MEKFNCFLSLSSPGENPGPHRRCRCKHGSMCIHHLVGKRVLYYSLCLWKRQKPLWGVMVGHRGRPCEIETEAGFWQWGLPLEEQEGKQCGLNLMRRPGQMGPSQGAMYTQEKKFWFCSKGKGKMSNFKIWDPACIFKRSFCFCRSTSGTYGMTGIPHWNRDSTWRWKFCSSSLGGWPWWARLMWWWILRVSLAEPLHPGIQSSIILGISVKVFFTWD